jgi:hypothetical protein
MASDTTRSLSNIKRYPWRPCLTCGQRTRRVDQICLEHSRTHQIACQACGAKVADARTNRRFCRPCRDERRAECKRQAKKRARLGVAKPRPPADHPCPDCGVTVPTRALRCQQCTARARAETLRERRAKSLPSGHVALSPRESGGIRWKAQAPAYPCATCKYGEASSASDSGWECLLLMAGRCRPWGEALFRTER